MSTTKENQPKVTIHSVSCGQRYENRVYAGPNPYGPQGGRCGQAVDAKYVSSPTRFAAALKVARAYAAEHGAALDLTPGQERMAAEIDAKGEAKTKAKARPSADRSR